MTEGKVTLKGLQPESGFAVKVKIGSGYTVMSRLDVSVQPFAAMAISLVS